MNHTCSSNPLLLLSLSLFTATALSAQQPQNKPTAQLQPTGASAVVLTPAGYSGPLNYVRTWEPLAPYTDPNQVLSAGYGEVRVTTQYVDGLGRPVQTVQRQASTTAKDVVAAVYYDQFGREAHKFLPYVDAGTTGTFKAAPFVDQKAFYQGARDAGGQPMYGGEEVFYSETRFEPSPLSRVEKVLPPGNSWAGSGRGVEQLYLINTAADNVPIWSIASNALTYTNEDITTNIPFSSGAYAPGELYKNVTVDEDQKAVVEYRDKEGRVVLKKVQVGTTIPADYSGYDNWLSTYYIYDDLGQLRFVVPPKAVEALQGDWTIAGKTDLINELCFRYEYDSRGRLSAKKVPGAGWVYMVYDVRDRLVFSQDANLRERGQWTATLYDALNRPVLTGILSYAGATPAVLQSEVTLKTSQPPATTGVLLDRTFSTLTSGTQEALRSITLEEGFESAAEFTAQIVAGPGGADGETSVVEDMAVNKTPLPANTTFVALTKTYYDEYTWTQKSYAAAYTDKVSAGPNPHAVALPAQAHPAVRGLVTGTRVRVLEDPNNLSVGTWLERVSFYDDRGRVIQLQSDNYAGGTETVTNLYDFSGKVLSTYQVHHNPKASPSTQLKVRTDYAYDHAGRVLEVGKVLNDEESKKATLAKNTYDELGQLIRKGLGRKKDLNGTYTAEPLEQLDFTYTVRGWLRGINSGYARPELPGSSTQAERYFGMELSYDWGFDQNQLGGNISGVRWRSRGDGEQRAYGFGYDGANRLLYGDFNQKFASTWAKVDPQSSSHSIDFSVQMGDGVDPTSAYDANGNIKAMQQWGLKLTGKTLIDDLKYGYFNGGNKLKYVYDEQAEQKLGDFTESAQNRTDNTVRSLPDYGYDQNGNLISDLNKKMNGPTEVDVASGGAITYNHLNLPWKITLQKEDGSGEKGTITYTYDAAGNKLKKVVVDKTVAPNKTTTTTYLGGMVYEQENSDPALLQFLSHEEGRIRPKRDANSQFTGFEYDYFVKDHLGNVRMVLTEEKQQDIYPAATLEGSLATTTDAAYIEKRYYTIDPAKVVNKSEATGISNYQNQNNGGVPYNPNPNSQVTANSEKLYKLRAESSGTGGVTGLGLTLKVMGGDKVDIFGKSYYFEPTSDNQEHRLPVDAVLNGLFGSPNSPAVEKATATAVGGVPLVTSAIATFLQNSRNEAGTKPKAYINWIFLDENFRYVSEGSSFDRVGDANVVKSHSVLGIPVKKSGYLYVYASNESPVSVFFDNVQVVHTRGPILEETHYYPFGLTMQGISSKAASFGGAENKRKFNDGTELESKEFSDGSGLELYSTEFRSYDPQIGRFHQIDPLAEFTYNWSPYAFVQNNPILYNDPLGLDTLKRNADGSLPTTRADGSKLQDVDVILGKDGQLANYYNGESWQAPQELESVTVTASAKKNDDASSQTPWMDVAKKEAQKDVKEKTKHGNDGPDVEKYLKSVRLAKGNAWCGAFVNWCFLNSGVPGLKTNDPYDPGRAFKYVNYGVKLNQPAYGAVAIMNYSHVGFVAGINNDGRIVLLGGNQGDALNYSPNAVSAVLQYRYPAGFKPNYNLPAFKLRGRSLSGSSSR